MRCRWASATEPTTVGDVVAILERHAVAVASADPDRRAPHSDAYLASTDSPPDPDTVTAKPNADRAIVEANRSLTGVDRGTDPADDADPDTETRADTDTSPGPGADIEPSDTAVNPGTGVSGDIRCHEPISERDGHVRNTGPAIERAT